MANFLDKIGELAKTAADKTNDLIEQNQLKAKITAEEAEITVFKVKIGDFYWNKFITTGTAEAEILDLCEGIKTSQAVIASLQEEINALKGEKPAEAAPAAIAEPLCPNCGTPNAPGTKFCKECGTKLG